MLEISGDYSEFDLLVDLTGLKIFTGLLACFKIVTVLILAGLDYNTLVNSCEDLQNPQHKPINRGIRIGRLLDPRARARPH